MSLSTSSWLSSSSSSSSPSPHSHFLHPYARLDAHEASDAGHLNMARDYAHYLLPRSLPDSEDGIHFNWTATVTPFSYGLIGVNQTRNYLLVRVSLILLSGLLLITWVYRWTRMGNSQTRHMLTLSREADQRYWMYNQTQLWPWIKKHILYAPLGKVRHNQEIQLSSAVSLGTLPSRYHSILLILYLAANIGFCLVLDWTQERYAVIAELRGRTGVLAAYNLIPTILFALRNNPLIWALRVSYDTFNLLHRWCARIVILESILHTAMWAMNVIQAGGFEQLRTSLVNSKSYTWGMVGTSCFVFVAIASAGPIRHAFYETFISGHRIMVLLGMIGVYIHLDAADLLPLPWVQLALALWAAEWVFRVLRIARRNYQRGKGFTRVSVEWLPSEACRVTFDLPRPWRWQPGCHVHAYIPALSGWSSHPFSVAWAEDRARNPAMEIEMEKISPGDANVATDPARPPALNARVHSHYFGKDPSTHIYNPNPSEPPHLSEEGLIALPRTLDVTSVSLIVRARQGMTRKLYEKLVKRGGAPYLTWGFIEGPYGGHESLSSYGTIILFAGGVGITHCVGYIHHLLMQYQAGLCSTRKILLVWSVPNTEALEWIRTWMDRILKMEHRREILRIQLFVTKPRHRGEVISSTGSVQMFPGRCNPSTIIAKEMSERIGAVGVSVCGPGGFADSVRAACRNVVTEGSLDFVEEAFTY